MKHKFDWAVNVLLRHDLLRRGPTRHRVRRPTATPTLQGVDAQTLRYKRLLLYHQGLESHLIAPPSKARGK